MGLFDRFSINKFMKCLKDEDRSIGHLDQILEKNDCDIACEKAARDLGRIGGEKAVEVLIKALNNNHIYVRREAAISLGKIRDERAVCPLSNLLEISCYTSGKYFIPSGGGFPIPYEKVRHPETVINRAYMEISDENLPVRIEAARALGEIGGKDAIKTLVKVLKNERKKERCWIFE